MTPPALTVEHLNAWYGAAQVLYDVAFAVDQERAVHRFFRRRLDGKRADMNVDR